MKHWRSFLQSLDTRGGNIFLCAIFVVIFLFLLIHVLHHAESSEQLRTVAIGAFSTFYGALIGMWQGRSALARASDREGEKPGVEKGGANDSRP